MKFNAWQKAIMLEKKNILVSGLINLETTLRVDSFPIHYSPVRYPFGGVQSTISGVGYNVARALTTLGDAVHFLSLIGKDLPGQLVIPSLQGAGVPTGLVLAHLPQTPQSVILFDGEGRRQINVDLKNIQETPYPYELFEAALRACSLAVCCNINFSRPFLQAAQRAGKPVATDVHAIGSLEDEYNREFMAAAQILFYSHEHLPEEPETFAHHLWQHYNPEIIVTGLGAEGVLLGVRRDNFLERIPAIFTRPVVNTIGAGDALFSAFTHYYHLSGDPYASIQKALVFASYKIGESGAAEGFLDASAVEAWITRIAQGLAQTD